MGDDLGRGQVSWPDERWQALNTIATDTVTQYAVLRNLVEHQEALGQHTVRISGKDVTVVQIYVALEYDMTQEDDADLDRRVRLKAQVLANAEDAAVLKAMNLVTVVVEDFGFEAFSKAKGILNEKNVKYGFGVIASSDVQSALEIQQAGVKSGLEVVELLLSTKVLQTNALPEAIIDKGSGKTVKISAVVLQASPAAYRLVQASKPQLRVLGNDGKTVRLQIEEWIAVGELEPDRCVGVKGKG